MQYVEEWFRFVHTPLSNGYMMLKKDKTSFKSGVFHFHEIFLSGIMRWHKGWTPAESMWPQMIPRYNLLHMQGLVMCYSRPWPPKHYYWDINWFALAGVLIALSCSFWCPASNTRTSIIQQFLYFAPLLCFRYLGSAGRSILTLPLLATRLTFSKQSILDVSFYSDSRM